jgi:hypothetical protein
MAAAFLAALSMSLPMFSTLESSVTKNVSAKLFGATTWTGMRKRLPAVVLFLALFFFAIYFD